MGGQELPADGAASSVPRGERVSRWRRQDVLALHTCHPAGGGEPTSSSASSLVCDLGGPQERGPGSARHQPQPGLRQSEAKARTGL